MDAPLSDIGKLQTDETRTYIRESDLVNLYAVDKIVHSPLSRARDTCYTLFPDFEKEVIGLIQEATPLEQLIQAFPNVPKFEAWLLESPYNVILRNRSHRTYCFNINNCSLTLNFQ